MSKYIDADKLIAGIDKILAETEKDEKKAFYKKDANGHLIAVTKTAICVSVKKIIASLQKEKPIDKNVLTWRDVNEIERIINKVHYEFPHGIGEEAFGKLVLERFIEGKDDLQEQPEENKWPNKRTRVNYAICKLQSFKPLREAIVLDDYVYDESKSYRENLLNYIHAIPESRLTEMRRYLKEKGWWPYDDDSDWGEQEQEVDLEREMDKYYGMYRDNNGKTYDTDNNEPCFDWEEDGLAEHKLRLARHFYKLGLNARKEGQK